MGLFREENHKILLDPEVKLIPEFKAIQARDKDRAKRNAFKEFVFIYFYTDFKSPYTIYDKDKRFKLSLKDAGLPEDTKLEGPLKKAVEKYRELQKTPAIRTLDTLRNALFTSLNAVEALNMYLNERVAQVTQSRDPMDEDEDEDMLDADPTPDVAEMVKAVTELVKLSKEIPNVITTLGTVEEQVKKEQSESRRVKGGGGVNQFEE